eukprot:TRINITY_DN8765_c0_g1_i1.p1 TRINITY_DN8765_c0_g1~~TRINITY_DN8765_c0_g1_i1.p1  ORF type:complete len:365 (-),score=81.03 TRINITY_DN8765_c0_g1_i1:80-1174(-)
MAQTSGEDNDEEEEEESEEEDEEDEEVVPKSQPKAPAKAAQQTPQPTPSAAKSSSAAPAAPAKAAQQTPQPTPSAAKSSSAAPAAPAKAAQQTPQPTPSAAKSSSAPAQVAPQPKQPTSARSSSAASSAVSTKALAKAATAAPQRTSSASKSSSAAPAAASVEAAPGSTSPGGLLSLLSRGLDEQSIGAPVPEGIQNTMAFDKKKHLTTAFEMLDSRGDETLSFEESKSWLRCADSELTEMLTWKTGPETRGLKPSDRRWNLKQLLSVSESHRGRQRNCGLEQLRNALRVISGNRGKISRDALEEVLAQNGLGGKDLSKLLMTMGFGTSKTIDSEKLATRLLDLICQPSSIYEQHVMSRVSGYD